MKTIKLLLVAVFGFAVAVPAVAQKVAAEKAKAGGTAKVLPVSEEEEKKADDTPIWGKKIGNVTQGKLNYHEFSIEANGTDMTATVFNEKDGYAITMVKEKNADGEIETYKYCSGNEDKCRVIAEGEKCREGVAPKKLCYVAKVGKADPKEGYVLPGGKPEVMPEVAPGVEDKAPIKWADEAESAPLEWADEALEEEAAPIEWAVNKKK